jgi:signal transduction histidine kinase
VRPEFDLQGEAAKVQYNAVNIAQVIRHLTDNAREAMPRGGTLKVSTEVCHSPNCDKPQQSSDSFLRVCFRDNGLGITIDNLSRIFEPYFSTKERGQQRGMGLGLALCEAIIRAHGGSISVESAQGQGAAFVIHLPAVKRDGP